MCAIIGVASPDPVRNRAWLAVGRDAMRHRGPDGAGEWWSADGRVGLGHRRLAILDLSDAAHQPMECAASDLSLVFNGEIYNFAELRSTLEEAGASFRSRSDTEVLLESYRRWGTDCVQRLNGMFAFAIYDAARSRLFLARDRAGEKPLYYAWHGRELRFASELKGLLADTEFPRKLSMEALDCLLATGYVPGALCIFAGVHKLPPAHAVCLELSSARLKSWRYWQLPDYAPERGNGSQPVLLEELEQLLERSVRRQLVADVPVGVLLSGGVDSSLVTAMAARANARVRTFTVRFPGYGKLDEAEHARLIADHFGTQHTEIEAEAASLSLLPVLARQFDEPLVDSSMIPMHIVSHLVRQHCTVALGGDGGDELFGGYPHYRRLLWLQSRMRCVPDALRALVAGGAAMAMPVGFKGRNWLQAVGENLDGGVPMVTGLFDRVSRRRLCGRDSSIAGSADEILDARVPCASDLLQRATRLDFENYLAEDILVKVDRASMLNSLEVRAPMLDVKLIEFAFAAVPSSLRATAREGKVLLKDLAARVLPNTFDRGRKQGFEIPLAAWLRTRIWSDYVRQVLLDGSQRLFDHGFIERLLQHQGRAFFNSERIFGLLLFELWRREYRVGL